MDLGRKAGERVRSRSPCRNTVGTVGWHLCRGRGQLGRAAGSGRACVCAGTGVFVGGCAGRTGCPQRKFDLTSGKAPASCIYSADATDAKSVCSVLRPCQKLGGTEVILESCLRKGEGVKYSEADHAVRWMR